MDPSTTQGLTLEGVVAIVTALVALVGVLVSVFTLANAARKDAFEQLRQVVETLKTQLDSAEKENERLLEKLEEREKKIRELEQRIDAQDKLISTLRRVNSKGG